jgi:hypothetical protein
MQQHDCEIAALQSELSQHLQAQESSSEALLGRVGRLEAELSALQTASALPLASPPSRSVSQAVVPIASAPAPTSPASAVARAPSGWNSAIVPDFPTLFEDFKRKRFALLWRGSRDGFGARDFHNRCDWHPNTLTVVLDTEGNIFGGFTPVEWESRKWNGRRGKGSNCFKADPSLKSFLFTLKNPHNVPARRFPLMAKAKEVAIQDDSNDGPNFNDLYISDNCNANTASGSNLGNMSYTNDTGLDGHTVFARSRAWQVREIEVFEITD